MQLNKFGVKHSHNSKLKNFVLVKKLLKQKTITLLQWDLIKKIKTITYVDIDENCTSNRIRITNLRARQRTFEGAYWRTSLAAFSTGLLILKVFTREFYKIGITFFVFGLALLAIALWRRRTAGDVFDLSIPFRTSVATVLMAGFSPFCLIIHSYNQNMLFRKVTRIIPRQSLKARPLSTIATATLIVTGIPTALYFYKCAMLVMFQNKLIYMGYIPLGSRHIQNPLQDAPPSLDIKEKTISTPDRIKLHGYIAKNKKAKKDGPILIYFQGNAGNMHDRFGVFKTILDAFPDMTIVAFSYRGYGNSIGGYANEAGIKKDSKAIFNYVLSVFDNDDQPIYIYGHSLGGAVAVDLVANLNNKEKYKRINGIILENTFINIYEMVCSLYPKYTPYPWIAKYCLFNHWYTNINLTKIPFGTRLLLLSSVNDEIVPFPHMLHLHEIAKSSLIPTFIPFRKSLHMDIFLKETKLYQKALRDFII
ncbi:unnamed protein product [Cunninghamella blakesleeana]